VIPKPGIIQ
jgi:hypothetical protein